MILLELVLVKLEIFLLEIHGKLEDFFFFLVQYIKNCWVPTSG